jgi:hypothetical protein
MGRSALVVAALLAAVLLASALMLASTVTSGRRTWCRRMCCGHCTNGGTAGMPTSTRCRFDVFHHNMWTQLEKSVLEKKLEKSMPRKKAREVHSFWWEEERAKESYRRARAQSAIAFFLRVRPGDWTSIHTHKSPLHSFYGLCFRFKTCFYSARLPLFYI